MSAAVDALKLALLQADLAWEDPQSNMKHLEAMLRALPGDVHLAVLPEMFSTGFTMKPQAVAEEKDGPVHRWLQKLSAQLGFAICGSIAAIENGRYYNRMLWAERGELRPVYDKRHLFRMAGEHEVYSAGKDTGLLNFRGWRIMPRICYDLRFPVWSRSNEALLQIYVANWPAVRCEAWDKLLMARAIENLCFVAGVNRVGVDGNGVDYSGHSAVIDFKGQPMATAVQPRENTLIISLDKSELEAFRQKFPAHLDADRFTIDI